MKDENNFKIAKTRLIRLVYYNDFLLKEGMLTNREHKKINNVIISKYGKELSNRLYDFSSTDKKINS